MGVQSSGALHPTASPAAWYTPASIFSRSVHAGGSIDTNQSVILALVLNQILSAGTHLIGKATLTAIGPLSTALFRFIIASIALLLIQIFRPRRVRIAREDIPKVLWLGFLAVPLNQTFFL